MVENYIDLLDTMIDMGLISRWQVMYKKMGLKVPQFADLMGNLYQDRRIAPDISAGYSSSKSITYKARHFQIDFEVRHDQGN
jgi:hypothetical protein